MKPLPKTSSLITDNIDQYLQWSEKSIEMYFSASLSRAIFRIYVTRNTAYIYDTGQSWAQQTMFTGHHDYPADNFKQDAATISDRLILACKSIPVCQEEPSDEPYRHGQHCWDLPDTMCECDMWVHGMYHEFVSDHFLIGWHNVMFSSALPLACHQEGPFTWSCCRELHSVTFPVGTVSNQSRGVSQKEFNNIWHRWRSIKKIKLKS